MRKERPIDVEGATISGREERPIFTRKRQAAVVVVRKERPAKETNACRASFTGFEVYIHIVRFARNDPPSDHLMDSRIS